MTWEDGLAGRLTGLLTRRFEKCTVAKVMPTVAEYERTALRKNVDALLKESDAAIMRRNGDIEPASEAFGTAGVYRQSSSAALRSAGNQLSRKRPPDLTGAAKDYRLAGLEMAKAAEDFEMTAKLDLQATAQATSAARAKRERQEAQDFLAEAAKAHRMAAEDFAAAAKALEGAGLSDDAKQRHKDAAKEYRKEAKDHRDLSRQYQNDPDRTDPQKNRLVGEESQKASEADDKARTQDRLAR